MTLLQAIEAVQTRAANNSIHDLVIPRNPPRQGPSTNRIGTGLHEMNLNDDEDDNDEEDNEEPYDDYDDNDDSLNAIRSGPSRGGRGGRTSRGGRGGGGRTGGRSGGRTLTPQQLEWFREQKCIQCGQSGHFKRDCPVVKSPSTGG
jgi:uncharacterized membrane protein YgcG